MATNAIDFSDRHTYVGASETGTILGLNPWKTPLELYLEKTQEATPPDLSDNQAVIFGNLLEDVVADEFTRRTGMRVQRDNRTFEDGIIRGHIDRRVIGVKEGLECKTAGIRMASEFGDEDTDQVPAMYLTQCLTYLLLTGWDRWRLAVLIGGNDYRMYTIERDDRAIELIRNRIQKFWSCVESRTPPPAMNADDLKILYPKDDGTFAEASLEICQVAQDLKTIKEAEKEIETRKKDLENQLKTFMGEHSGLLAPDGKTLATWKASEMNLFDAKSFKETHPDLAAQFTRKQSVRRLLIK